jgi:hypothetical protein
LCCANSIVRASQKTYNKSKELPHNLLLPHLLLPPRIQVALMNQQTSSIWQHRLDKEADVEGLLVEGLQLV